MVTLRFCPCRPPAEIIRQVLHFPMSTAQKVVVAQKQSRSHRLENIAATYVSTR